jgi:hypothetical protein
MAVREEKTAEEHWFRRFGDEIQQNGNFVSGYKKN